MNLILKVTIQQVNELCVGLNPSNKEPVSIVVDFRLSFLFPCVLKAQEVLKFRSTLCFHDLIPVASLGFL